jgi:hypothetical protein
MLTAPGMLAQSLRPDRAAGVAPGAIRFLGKYKLKIRYPNTFQARSRNGKSRRRRVNES